jgi:uncharacterized membrane protein
MNPSPSPETREDQLDAVSAATPPMPAAAPPVAATDAGKQTAELALVYGAARTTLTLGFRIGAAFLTIGIVVALVRQEPLRSEAQPLTEIIPALFDGRASALVELAILSIISTPVVAALVIAVGFFRIGDRLYAMLSLLVLLILGTSIVLALLR